ncbi:hypothetical protein EYB53_012715 [Candidatus Chloroploca sp. M-50]|uniref:Bacterial spore germination immunoglobulin-like domain-containing protein n=1 Tax=Candidatus Chloroploca mongolica TaxID=2528176 RepID=A0ABS4DAT7_9CHLR|nr:Gmad2 immunoglobulin-like domain-containing protein [Candidatus Chloroploca mongolica]MBP1466570.1 hypothetical protein [Candidatus Chloroploca mongolica]
MSMRYFFGLLLLLTIFLPLSAAAQTSDPPAFRTIWERSDYPVQQGRGSHSWLWGPVPRTQGLREWYVDGPEQFRSVQYFDKGRMEINDPLGDPASLWFVTSGLLVRDMIDGRVQVGNGAFVALAPATIPVAGDPNATFPTYADLQPYVRVQPRLGPGDTVAERLTPVGLRAAPEFANLAAARIDSAVVNGYGIPRAFWSYLNEGGVVYEKRRFVQVTPRFDWLYIAGYPLADAFWVRVPIAGVERDVMVQPFERRLLTYTPSNPPQFQVEMGNVGLHYYRWRYELPFAEGQQALITVPAAATRISSPVLVQGFERGRAFEAGIDLRLRTASGAIIAQGGTSVQRPDLNIPGPFVASLVFTPPETETPGVIEVFVISPLDGSETIIARQPVIIEGLARGIDRAIALAQADLIKRTGASFAAISLHLADEVVWPDGSLGCPEPGQNYLQVLTPGYQIVLKLDEQFYDYHTDTRTAVILCRNGRPAG